MKILIGAAAVLLMCGSVATAQTPPAPTAPEARSATPIASQCPALPPEPTIPDGAVADNAAMEAANVVYMNWGTSMQAAIACRRGEYETYLESARVRREEHNAAAARLSAVTEAWQGETLEFCARPRQRCEAPAQ